MADGGIVHHVPSSLPLLCFVQDFSRSQDRTMKLACVCPRLVKIPHSEFSLLTTFWFSRLNNLLLNNSTIERFSIHKVVSVASLWAQASTCASRDSQISKSAQNNNTTTCLTMRVAHQNSHHCNRNTLTKRKAILSQEAIEASCTLYHE